jgi:ferredoxin-NADP reductase/ferredoxin/truncated hemoglobin YjbI
MPYINYQGREYFCRSGENVLDAMLRNGVSVPFSCRNGVCHVCVQRCMLGELPAVAQNGLSQELRDQGYFKACQCEPLGDMLIAPPVDLFAVTRVHSLEMLSDSVGKILLEPLQTTRYRAGQFINLRRPDGLIRSYSLASLPEQDYFLEIQVERKLNGEMSNWLLDTLSEGDAVEMQQPEGDCYYQDNTVAHPMLLIATGTGLSPLVGILRDALHHSHQGQIYLYHGGRTPDRFYLHDVLRQLEAKHDNFHYYPCLSGDVTSTGDYLTGRADDIAFAQHPDLRDWQIYLAGLTAMVDSARILAVEHGATPDAIHADAFEFKERQAVDVALFIKQRAERAYPPPDPDLWTALHNGELLMTVLKDFYTRVFADEKLLSFFHGVTKQRSIEKQYLFMRQILTGEKIYFGERPRNSHHWMVISDDLFDYRAEIMVSCLREHGLPDAMIHRFRDVEEFFRGDIVKTAPFARVMGDVEVPFEGFGEITMDVGTLCDACEREVSKGEKVIYHVRLGKIYCSDCSEQHHHEIP